MRKNFLGYYRPKKEEFHKMWQDCIFVFDANILLNIYRYTPKTRDSFLEILRQLKERLWLPHQAAHEYFENRENVISQQYSISDEIEGFLNTALQGIREKYSKGHPFANTSEIERIITKAIKDIKAVIRNAESKSHNLLIDDVLLDQITELFDEKVGQPFTKARLEELQKEAEIRFKEQIPPGFKDSDKKGSRQYGDVILWFQLIDFAKSEQKPIVFTTDDNKEDWWRKDKGKTLGPRPELIEEVYSKAGVQFYMYQATEFMKRAQEFLGIKIESEAIEEVQEIRQQDEKEYQRMKEYQRLKEYLRSSEYQRSKEYLRLMQTILESSKDLHVEKPHSLTYDSSKFLETILLLKSLNETMGRVSGDKALDRETSPIISTDLEATSEELTQDDAYINDLSDEETNNLTSTDEEP